MTSKKDSEPTLEHAHTATGIVGDGDTHHLTIPHSHSDTDRLTMLSTPTLRKRELLHVDEDIYASTHSLTWAGQQTHVMTAHIAAETDQEIDGGILAPTVDCYIVILKLPYS